MKPNRLGKIFLLLALSLWVAPADAGEIRGRVQIVGSPGPTRAELNPYAGQLGNLSQQSSGGVRTQDVVIFIEGSKADPPQKPDSFVMMQKGQAFVPRVLAVPVGSTVDFPNSDPVFHNVFSYSRTKRFDLGRYGKGKSKPVVFDKPGVVKVFCEIHSNMSGFVYVVDGTIVSQPSASGNFVMKNVPAGQHELVIWHPDRGERRMNVDIQEGKPLNLEIAL